MFFDVLGVAQQFHKLVDKNVVGVIVNSIHSCKVNMTNEKSEQWWQTYRLGTY